MKKQKILLALLLAGFSICAGAFALTGCSNKKGSNSSDVEIGDQDTPLDDGSSTHTHDALRKAAKEATCNTVGNKEYWYCEDCNTYFADAGLTQQTTLAAVTLGINEHNHVNVDEVAATAADCVTPGNQAYWHCLDCDNYYLDEDYTQETTLEGIETAIDTEHGHKIGELIAAVPNKCEDGLDAHSVCENCGQWFNEDGIPCTEEDLILATAHNTQHVDSADGYYVCLDCYKTFADAAGTHEIDVNNTVNDADSLKAALEIGGLVVVGENINISETISIDKDAIIDLNGCAITSSANVVIAVSNNATVVIANGTIASVSTDKGHVVKVVNAAVTLDGVAIEANENVYGVLAGSNANIELKNASSIKGASYAAALGDKAVFTMNGGSITECECGIFADGTATMSGCQLTLTDVTISTKYAGVYCPQIDGTTVISGGSITSEVECAVEVRAGTVTIKDGAKLESKNTTFKGPQNANGSSIEGAALGISQHSTHNAINVNLEGCELTGVYAIYEKYVMNGEHTTIGIKLSGDNTIKGEVYTENAGL